MLIRELTIDNKEMYFLNDRFEVIYSEMLGYQCGLISEHLRGMLSLSVPSSVGLMR